MHSYGHKKKTMIANDIDATLISINNFLEHFINEINILRYRDHQRILPKNIVVDIYRYSIEC